MLSMWFVIFISYLIIVNGEVWYEVKGKTSDTHEILSRVSLVGFEETLENSEIVAWFDRCIGCRNISIARHHVMDDSILAGNLSASSIVLHVPRYELCKVGPMLISLQKLLDTPKEFRFFLHFEGIKDEQVTNFTKLVQKMVENAQFLKKTTNLSQTQPELIVDISQENLVEFCLFPTAEKVQRREDKYCEERARSLHLGESEYIDFPLFRNYEKLEELVRKLKDKLYRKNVEELNGIVNSSLAEFKSIAIHTMITANEELQQPLPTITNYLYYLLVRSHIFAYATALYEIGQRVTSARLVELFKQLLEKHQLQGHDKSQLSKLKSNHKLLFDSQLLQLKIGLETICNADIQNGVQAVYPYFFNTSKYPNAFTKKLIARAIDSNVFQIYRLPQPAKSTEDLFENSLNFLLSKRWSEARLNGEINPFLRLSRFPPLRINFNFLLRLGVMKEHGERSLYDRSTEGRSSQSFNRAEPMLLHSIIKTPFNPYGRSK